MIFKKMFSPKLGMVGIFSICLVGNMMVWLESLIQASFFFYAVKILHFTYILVLSHLERNKNMLIHFLTSIVCHEVSFSSLSILLFS